MAITVVLEQCDLPTHLWFVMIRGIPGANRGFPVTNALPWKAAERLKNKVEAALARFPESDAPKVPKQGKTAWKHLSGAGSGSEPQSAASPPDPSRKEST